MSLQCNTKERITCQSVKIEDNYKQELYNTEWQNVNFKKLEQIKYFYTIGT